MLASLGTEWLIDAAGCNADQLRDVARLRQFCHTILTDLGLHVVGEGHWHRFPDPGGVTGLFLLTESHLAMHTYPEYGSLTLSLYCCRSRPPWPWQEQCRAWLGAEEVHVRQFHRGVNTPVVWQAGVNPDGGNKCTSQRVPLP